MTRTRTLIMAASLGFFFVAWSPARLVGDGREYLAQAIQFASLRGPAFRPIDIPHIQEELTRFDPSLANWDIWSSTIPDVHRGRVFLHFWFYALLAAPGVRLATALGAPPTLGFTALNFVLLGVALWVVLPRLGPAACVLLFAGPIVWWLDKAHTEVFTFALLTIAFLEMQDRPWWSMVAAGMASTQNPPIAVVVLIAFVVTVLRTRSALRDRRVVVGAVVGLTLALLHPVYSYTHHGTVSLLLMQTRSGGPTFQTLSAVVLDPSVGLIGNFPIFLIVVIAAALMLVRDRRRRVLDTALIPALVGAIFLFSFSRTTNLHHGGTPSISRYAVWLIPLAGPLLAWRNQTGESTWRRFLWCAAVTSAVISLVAFRPSVPQNSREPTWLATFLWTRLPAWNNPLPEVFIETQLQIDDLRVPVATSGCEKVLVAGGDVERGIWPSPCYPAALPVECQTPGVLCYANLSRRRYAFVPVRGTTVDAAAVRGDAVWPGNTVVHVRRLYDSWNWAGMHAGTVDRLRGDKVWVESLGSNERFILVLRDPREGATVTLQPPTPMHGVLVDALTGTTLRTVDSGGQRGVPTRIDLPSDARILLLAMQATSRKNTK